MAPPKPTSDPGKAKFASLKTGAGPVLALSAGSAGDVKPSQPLGKGNVMPKASYFVSTSHTSDSDPSNPSASSDNGLAELSSESYDPEPPQKAKALPYRLTVSEEVRVSNLVYPTTRIYRRPNEQTGRGLGVSSGSNVTPTQHTTQLALEVSSLKALFAAKNPQAGIDVDATYFNADDDSAEKDNAIRIGLGVGRKDADEESEDEDSEQVSEENGEGDEDIPSRDSTTDQKGKGKGKAMTLARHCGLDVNVPPISKIDEIFDKITKRSLEQLPGQSLKDVLQHLSGRNLRVGTMCSGTESPILALGLVNDSRTTIPPAMAFLTSLVPGLKRLGCNCLEIEHVFSCEIEPFKQAYIQRNFSPPILFRDVRELGGTSAHTAYGAEVDIPGELDLLVAGSSCIDFSSLNSNKKDLEEEGESFQTLNGILQYAKRYTPRIVVLENVSGAPWPKVEQLWRDMGYATKPALLDTKNFYIPQTRSRGYMVAYHVGAGTEMGVHVEGIANEWFDKLESFQQRASSSFTDFIFQDDDPQLLRAKLALLRTLESSTAEWVNCRHRHITYRSAMNLGFDRPFTQWRNNASCILPDDAWQGWAKVQVERIWDTLDINHLRSIAFRDYEMTSKSRWLDLSQNIDRDIDSRSWGIVGCITPSGMPYLTSRGGPVIGREVLALQGIPTWKLSLTKETHKQLQDLAGNAMTSTVVGCAILAALACGFPLLDTNESGAKAEPRLPDTSHWKDKLLEPSPSVPMRRLTVSLGPDSHHSLEELQLLAYETLQLCSCEGNSTRKDRSFQQCSDCGHVACKACGLSPVHRYRDAPQHMCKNRKSPSDFEKKIRQVIPLQIQTSPFPSAAAAKPKAIPGVDESDLMAAINSAFDAKVTLTKIRRGRTWIITYDGLHSRLELTLRRKWKPSKIGEQGFGTPAALLSTQWLLYAKPASTEPSGSSLRKILSQPVARMKCSTSLFEGDWQIRIPAPISFKLRVEGTGDLVDSWEKKQGIQDPMFSERKVWESLNVELISEKGRLPESFPRNIFGTYKLHQDCAAACGTLHRKVQAESSDHEAVFFFLDPQLMGNGSKDPFVFATSHDRKLCGDTRDLIAQVKTHWRPDASERVRNLDCTIPGTWETCQTPSLITNIPDTIQQLVHIGNCLGNNIDWRSCEHSSRQMLECSFPLDYGCDIFFTAQDTMSIDVIDHPTALGRLSWLVQRASRNCSFEDWRDVSFVDSSFGVCEKCAPAAPLLTWKLVYRQVKTKGQKARNSDEEPSMATVAQKSQILVADEETTTTELGEQLEGANLPTVLETADDNTEGANKESAKASADKTDIKLFEDPVRAFEFEKNLKTRPSPIIAQVRRNESVGTLKVDMNVLALAHRAYAKLFERKTASLQTIRVQWRLAADCDAEEAETFPKVTLLSNKDELKSAQPPNFKDHPLEENQLKSLTWMLNQEDSSGAAWTEREIEEARMPSAQLRLEAMVEVDRTILGGVLADEVGYGKTATTLGLIDRAAGVNPITDCPVWQGGGLKIPLKATLIMVPKKLIGQWQAEISKFLRGNRRYKLEVLKNSSYLESLSVERLKKADIILASWTIFDNTYFKKFAAVCHAENVPEGGRAFNEWLQQGMGDLGDLVKDSNGGEKGPFFARWNAMKDREVNYERFVASSKRDKRSESKPAQADQDPTASQSSPPRNKTGNKRAASPGINAGPSKRQKSDGDWVKKKVIPILLHLYEFHRIVIDEFTYCDGRHLSALLELTATRRWILSGTPPLGSFDDINKMAKFLGTSLSNDDDGALFRPDSRRKMEGSSAEEFRSYQVHRSPSWYRHKHSLALEFLKRFVRQNPADIAHICRYNHFNVVRLSTLERAAYFEMHQNLMSNSVRFNKTLPPIKFPDRRTRTEQLLDYMKGSKNPEDALLTTCSIKLNLVEDTDTTVEGDSKRDVIIAEKENRYCDTLTAIRDLLHEAFSHWKVYGEEPAEKNPHFHAYLRCIQKNRLGDEVSQAILVNIMKHEKLLVDQTAAKLLDQELHGRDSAAKDLKKDGGEKTMAKRTKSMKTEVLKVIATKLTNLSLSLIDDIRALRFFKAVKGVTTKNLLPICSGCSLEIKDPTNTLIMGLCGHISCSNCFANRDPRTRTKEKECVAQGCKAAASQHSTIQASVLVEDEADATPIHGTKLDAVMELVKDLVQERDNPDDNDYVLIFVQFDRIRDALAEALRDADIRFADTTLPLKTNLQSKADREPDLAELAHEMKVIKDVKSTEQQRKAAYKAAAIVKKRLTVKDKDDLVENFKGGKGGRVCLLKIDSVDAAGWNLQIANHVIFVSSVFTTTQYEYDSSITQAIGRSLRKNQKKEVHVYRFLTAQTIDVNILQKRENKILIKRGGEFMLVEAEEVDEEQDECGWEGTPFEGAKALAGEFSS